MTMTLPPHPPAPVQKKILELRGFQKAAAELAQRIQLASEAIVAAGENDEAAYAEAIRTGKDDPGSPAVDAARQALEDLERRERGTRVAAAQVQQELESVVASSVTSWEASNAKRGTEAAKALEAALATAEKAVADLADSIGTSMWLARSESERRRGFKPGTSFSTIEALNGEPHSVAVLLAAVSEWLDTRGGHDSHAHLRLRPAA